METDMVMWRMQEVNGMICRQNRMHMQRAWGFEMKHVYERKGGVSKA